MTLQRTIGNRATAQLLRAPESAGLPVQLRPYPGITVQRAHDPGDRISFTRDGVTYSGLVVRIKTPSDSDAEVVYVVDTNLDGRPTSLLVKNGRLLSIDMPDLEDVDTDVDRIVGLGVREVTAQMIEGARAENIPFRARIGDILVGTGIVISKPAANDRDTAAATAAKQTFLHDVLRDLILISRTKSGLNLLASIEVRAQNTELRNPRTGAVQTFIEFVDGFENRSQANPRGGGTGAETSDWLAVPQRADTGASATVGYNPSVAGLAVRDQAHASDELIFPALEQGFGRPKEKPADVTLFHEMVHADDIMHGRLYATEAPSGGGKVKVSEMHAVGLKEYADTDFLTGVSDAPEMYSENTYRKERGVKLRPWYGGDEENQPDVGNLARPGHGEVSRPLEVLPGDYSAAGKFFRSKKKVTARADAIAAATARNTTRTRENELIAISENRAKLVAEIQQTNRAAMDHVELVSVDD